MCVCVCVCKDSVDTESMEFRDFQFFASLISQLHAHRHIVLWLPSEGMDSATRVQNLGEAVCISKSAKTLVKCMNQIILSLTMGKY